MRIRIEKKYEYDEDWQKTISVEYADARIVAKIMAVGVVSVEVSEAVKKVLEEKPEEAVELLRLVKTAKPEKHVDPFIEALETLYTTIVADEKALREGYPRTELVKPERTTEVREEVPVMYRSSLDVDEYEEVKIRRLPREEAERLLGELRRLREALTSFLASLFSFSTRGSI